MAHLVGQSQGVEELDGSHFFETSIKPSLGSFIIPH